MRPLFGDTPPPTTQRARPSDNAGPTAFFIGDEAAVDAALEQSLSTFITPRDPRKQTHQTQQQQQQAHSHLNPLSSVESAPCSPSKPFSNNNTTTTTTTVTAHDVEASIPATPSLAGDGDDDDDEHPDDACSLSSDHATPFQPHFASAAVSSTETSRPLTPLLLPLSGPASAISGVSSRRNSVTASVSEDLGASVELEPESEPAFSSSSMMDSGSVPQLVMPSIKMPSRRPFTDEGKRLGRLKLLIAGDSGIGKTALIKAIVQISDAIVHIDPILAPPGVFNHRSSPRFNSKSKHATKSSNATDRISEISASTKPYPEWWSDLDDSRLLKRRKSLGGDTILDRNICFIDTPGYSDGSSSMESISPVIRYIESHLEAVHSNTSSDSELLNMLGGDGGNQVDLVLYLIQNRLKPADIKYLQLLSSLTNVIPLLAQADIMTPEAIRQSKERVRSELKAANVRPFSFTTSVHGREAESLWPYAVSSLPGSDHDIMDASLLMSPDYVQPLVGSDLGVLVDQIFCETGASWLRHAAAKKFLQWRNSDKHPARPQGLYRPLSLQTGAGGAAVATTGASSTSLVATAAAASPPRTYMLARIADHTQREERMAEIRLANWASDLQRSFANEKARYEALARGERAIWLTEKLNECVQDGTLVPVHDRTKSSTSSSKSGRSSRRSGRLPRDWKQDTAAMPHQDPLGLLEVTTRLRDSGWIALEVLGGVGILGGAVFWFSKSHGWHVQTVAWAVESWSAFWDGER